MRHRHMRQRHEWNLHIAFGQDDKIALRKQQLLQAMQQRSGRLAITLLVLSLACTPLSNLLGARELIKRSRTLGLYAFMVAFLHILIFLDLDNGLTWDFFAQTIAQKPYILFGMATFIMLIPLAGLAAIYVFRIPANSVLVGGMFVSPQEANYGNAELLKDGQTHFYVCGLKSMEEGVVLAPVYVTFKTRGAVSAH